MRRSKKIAFPWGKVVPKGPDEGGYRGCGGHRGRTQRSAPTKAIVTLRRGGCPHPPVRWPPHPTIPTLIRPLRGHLPYPFCPFGTFPLDKGNRPLTRGPDRTKTAPLVKGGRAARRRGDSGPLRTAAPTVIARQGIALTWLSVPQSPLPPPLGEVAVRQH